MIQTKSQRLLPPPNQPAPTNTRVTSMLITNWLGAMPCQAALVVAAASVAAAASRPAGSPPPTCTVSTYKGCFADTAAARVLNFTAAFGTQPSDLPHMSRETCAQACCAAGFIGDDVLVGVEFAVQCFCGHGFSGGVTPPASSGCQAHCPGNPGETCGGSDAIDVFVASCPGASSPGNLCADPFAPPTGPEFQGCADPGAVGSYECVRGLLACAS